MARPKSPKSSFVRSSRVERIGVSPRDPEPKKRGPKRKQQPLPPADVIAEAVANINLSDSRWASRDRPKPAGKWSGKETS